MNAKVATERITWIDMIKGIGIIMVIVGHVLGVYRQEGDKYIEVAYELIYSFHMPLMFIMSGWLISQKRPERIGQYILKNLIALYIPYLIFAYGYWLERLFANRVLDMELGQELAVKGKDILAISYQGIGQSWFLLSL